MFAHKLVRYGIGGHTVQGLSDEMTVDEFLRWMAFDAIKPFGDDLANWLNAYNLAQRANMNRKKGKKAYQPNRFLAEFKFVSQEAQPVEQMEMALKARFTAMGGKLN